MSRALREHERALVGATIISVSLVVGSLGDDAGLRLHLSNGRVFKLEGDPTIGSRDVWVWPEDQA